MAEGDVRGISSWWGGWAPGGGDRPLVLRGKEESTGSGVKGGTRGMGKVLGVGRKEVPAEGGGYREWRERRYAKKRWGRGVIGSGEREGTKGKGRMLGEGRKEVQGKERCGGSGSGDEEGTREVEDFLAEG